MWILYNTSARFASVRNDGLRLFPRFGAPRSVRAKRSCDLAAQTAHQKPVADPFDHMVVLPFVSETSIEKDLSDKRESRTRDCKPFFSVLYSK